MDGRDRRMSMTGPMSEDRSGGAATSSSSSAMYAHPSAMSSYGHAHAHAHAHGGSDRMATDPEAHRYYQPASHRAMPASSFHAGTTPHRQSYATTAHADMHAPSMHYQQQHQQHQQLPSQSYHTRHATHSYHPHPPPPPTPGATHTAPSQSYAGYHSMSGVPPNTSSLSPVQPSRSVYNSNGSSSYATGHAAYASHYSPKFPDQRVAPPPPPPPAAAAIESDPTRMMNGGRALGAHHYHTHTSMAHASPAYPSVVARPPHESPVMTQHRASALANHGHGMGGHAAPHDYAAASAHRSDPRWYYSADYREAPSMHGG
ncbi:hypothetical protein SYNPS1DRAFT_30492 [Syncephalis pseudoplumigaleata]|uniref:Uncharacterized protein n=1 Tax=Syncephalis pseudoplumigaleata TaxID=1712513 RepID=A0A4P9YWA4_9FUNG|nr:hypothetical protein SYNPS1DRAFT_30492 [Syncephalis pseudoplumigaleata]|eukprot:RKP23752.1 hypothetical protein SYNPS1DRAFT_30492 [Syncephalis pseudoplumigaleata]